MKKKQKLAAVMAAVLLLSGCGGEPAETTAATQPAPDTRPTEAAAVTTAPTEPSIADGMEFAPTEAPGIAVDTPYITLYCPEEWRDAVKVDQKEENGTYTVTFHTTVADMDTVLFSVIFSAGETVEGFPLGTLEDGDAGTVSVYAAMNEELPETWGDEEITQFGAMQERVNDLIMQLHEDSRFDSGR